MKIQNAFRLGLIGTLGVGLGVGILMSVVALSTILTYIATALFLSLGLEPIVSFLERRHFPRWLAIVTVLVVVGLLITGLLFAIIPVLADQITQLYQQISTFISNGGLQDTLDNVQTVFPDFKLENAVSDLTSYLQTNIAQISSTVVTIVAAIGNGFFGAIVVIILTIYFTASLNSIKRATYQLVPASKRARFADLAEQITDSVGKYVMGQVSLALVNGILSAIVLTFIFRAQYSLLLAAIAFLFSLIPLVGTITGSVIITLLCLAFSGGPTAIAAAIYYLIYMQVEAYLLSPRIMNRAVSVPGAVVVIAALAGGSLLGILGALVAIPVAASILLIIKQVLIPRQNEL